MKAAARGEKNAQFNVGLMHQKGDGVILDESLAVEWFKKTARKGLPQGKKELQSRGIQW